MNLYTDKYFIGLYSTNQYKTSSWTMSEEKSYSEVKRNYEVEQKAFIPKVHCRENKDYFKTCIIEQNLLDTKQRNGTKLYTQQVLPSDGKIKGIIVLSHGYAEHSGRYVEFATQLCTKFNFAIGLIDHYGHGLSDGLPGYLPSIYDVSKDLIEYTEWLKKKFHSDGNKIFLIGNSMGGLIGFVTVKSKPDIFNGYISMGPLVIPTNPPNLVVTYIAYGLNYLASKLAMIDPQLDNINTDKKIYKEFIADGLSYTGKLRIGTGLAMQEAFLELQNHCDQITTPILIQHGDIDTACDVKGSKLVYEKAKSKDKELKIYKDQNHELLWEPLGKDVLNDIFTWIEKRL